MFTKDERAYFLARARLSYQARLDARRARDAANHRLAWAYALLDEVADAAENGDLEDALLPQPWDAANDADPAMMAEWERDRAGAQREAMRDAAFAAAARRPAGAIARALENPMRVTLWVMGLGAIALLALALADTLHVPGLPHPIAPATNDLLAWFPGDAIAAALIVFGLAHGARWVSRRFG